MTPKPAARIKDAPEDFVVVEIPTYEASGEGPHLFVKFTKKGLTTDDAVRAFAHAAGVQVRDIGVAGMKDKIGVTTQTISLPVPNGGGEAFDAKVRSLELPGITILEALRHGNKLKTGHLQGNHFTIMVRGLAPSDVDPVIASLERSGREGIPNAFGSQRFGRERDNAAQALSWLTGKTRPPRDPRKRRFLWSALQSALFNELLDRRVDDGTWRTPLLGDLLKKTDSGGLFDCTDETTDRARAERGEVVPTGPMFGTKMREPSGKPHELERAVFIDRLGSSFDLAQTKPYGEGTRRPLVLGIEALTVERVDGGATVTESMKRSAEKDAAFGEQLATLKVCFVLPKGAYATSVLGTAIAFEPEVAVNANAPASDHDRTDVRTDTETELE